MLMNKRDFDQRVENFFKHYHDRGMVKWAGFYLSDHQLKIRQKKQQESYVEPKQAEMSLHDISQILFKAFSEERRVSVQLNFLNQEGRRERSYTGHVLGVAHDKVIIDNHIFMLAEINHVEILGPD